MIPPLARSVWPLIQAPSGPARLGLGLVQVPRFHAAIDLEWGTLVHVLPDCPPSSTPVSLLYPRSRQLSPRVRVFVDWLVRMFGSGRR